MQLLINMKSVCIQGNLYFIIAIYQYSCSIPRIPDDLITQGFACITQRRR